MISDVCDSIGANKEKVLDSIGSDSRIGNKYFRPGYSFGGPCFPRDTRALALFVDQNNIKRVRFGRNNFHQILSKNLHLPFANQQMALEKALNAHMKGTEQRDDILCIGFKLC